MNNLFKSPFIVGSISDDENHQPTSNFVIPISEARLHANRENAQLSSGAKTPEGKAIVAQNATRHGLSGKFRVLAWETQSEFDELFAGLLTSYTPADDAETQLVTSMGEALWLTRRAVRLQDRCIDAIESENKEAAKTARQNLTLYLRYQTTHERSYQRFAAELRKLQSDRKKAEIGFVSQKHKEVDQQRKQERHEAAAAYQKMRTEYQDLKNRFLLPKVRMEERMEQRRIRDGWYK